MLNQTQAEVQKQLGCQKSKGKNTGRGTKSPGRGRVGSRTGQKLGLQAGKSRCIQNCKGKNCFFKNKNKKTGNEQEQNRLKQQLDKDNTGDN